MAKQSVTERFWAKVNKTDTCWLWTASLARGYGQFWLDGLQVKAHRLSWELTHGPIPNSLCVCHSCDVPTCVNPSHLFLGTFDDNNKDRAAKGRSNVLKGVAVRCAKLTDADVRAIRTDHRRLREIAADYHVSESQISEIRNGKSWRHVSP